jgi:branched-chain amino acid transport system ATP-binding protein
MLDATAKPDAQVENLLEVNNIEVIYNSVILVLKGVSLNVPKGGITALLGGNGAGKTTTLKAISNLLHSERGEVTKGSIKYRNEAVHKSDPADMVKRGVVQVMEGRHCFEHLTIEENLLTGAYTRTDGKAATARDLEMVYEYFPRLRERRKSQAGYTSGGEQQMLAIARAMMNRPKMLLCDEPSLGLAPIITRNLFKILGELRDEMGMAMLVVEQNAGLSLQLADRAYVLETGGIVATGTGEELLADDTIKQAYLGGVG